MDLRLRAIVCYDGSMMISSKRIDRIIRICKICFISRKYHTNTKTIAYRPHFTNFRLYRGYKRSYRNRRTGA